MNHKSNMQIKSINQLLWNKISFPSNQKIIVNDTFIVLITWPSLKRPEQLVLSINKNTDESIHSTVNVWACRDMQHVNAGTLVVY